MDYLVICAGEISAPPSRPRRGPTAPVPPPGPALAPRLVPRRPVTAGSTVGGEGAPRPLQSTADVGAGLERLSVVAHAGPPKSVHTRLWGRRGLRAGGGLGPACARAGRLTSFAPRRRRAVLLRACGRPPSVPGWTGTANGARSSTGRLSRGGRDLLWRSLVPLPVSRWPGCAPRCGRSRGLGSRLSRSRPPTGCGPIGRRRAGVGSTPPPATWESLWGRWRPARPPGPCR